MIIKKINKEIQSLHMPWEEEYGYAQAVKKRKYGVDIRSIGHNEKGVLAVGMEEQLKQAYKNAKKLLEGFGMSLEDVAEEVLYVLDMKTAFEARKTFGRKFLSELQTSSQYNSYGWRISYTQSIN